MNKGRLLPVAALAAIAAILVFTGGCGGSGDPEVTVQTGSLSREEFIAKADAICKAARTEFVAKFTNLINTHKAVANGDDIGKKEELIAELVETILTPNIEGQIAQISKLGAPADYAPEATTFLDALQQRLDEAQAEPKGITETPFPFKRAEAVARKVGLSGCAESFS